MSSDESESCSTFESELSGEDDYDDENSDDGEWIHDGFEEEYESDWHMKLLAHLHNAVHAKDAEVIRQFCLAHPNFNINAPNPDQLILYELICRVGWLDGLKVVVDLGKLGPRVKGRGRRMHATDEDRTRMANAAISGGHMELADYLFDKKIVEIDDLPMSVLCSDAVELPTPKILFLLKRRGYKARSSEIASCVRHAFTGAKANSMDSDKNGDFSQELFTAIMDTYGDDLKRNVKDMAYVLVVFMEWCSSIAGRCNVMSTAMDSSLNRAFVENASISSCVRAFGHALARGVDLLAYKLCGWTGNRDRRDVTAFHNALLFGDSVDEGRCLSLFLRRCPDFLHRLCATTKMSTLVEFVNSLDTPNYTSNLMLLAVLGEARYLSMLRSRTKNAGDCFRALEIVKKGVRTPEAIRSIRQRIYFPTSGAANYVFFVIAARYRHAENHGVSIRIQ